MRAPESIAATLAALDAIEPFGLFLRHAERETLPPEDPYADVGLTPLGVASAADLGRWTGSRLSWTATSPFRRCRRTAELLHPGAPEVDARLGEPGPWVLERGKGAELFSRLGVPGVVRAQIRRATLESMRSLPDGARLLLSAAMDRIAAGRGSGACVSHDAVLMPALHWLTGDPLDDDWLEPLDGFAIQRRHAGGELVCTWRGRAYPVPAGES